MDLRQIVSQILKEDAPIGGTQPAPQPSSKLYDVLRDFQNFERTIDKQTEAARKQLEQTLTKNIGKKKIVVRASKGTMGQIEQDYQIDVKGVSITFLKDEYFIVVKASDGKDYYVNTANKIKIIGDSTASDPAEKSTDQSPQTQQSVGQNSNISSNKPRATSGIVQPQNMGLSTAGGSPNTLPK